MDIDRAKEIVSALAEGIDPATGELLPENSICNRGDIVRALYALLRECNNKKSHQANRKVPDTYDVVLYNRLKEVRNRIAGEKSLPVYMILPNYPLMYMAAEKPTTINELLNIYGIGEYTAKHYGSIFIEEIIEYLGSNK